MSEEVKETTARKKAPAITVSSPASRSSIDELHRDNPGKNFAYAPLNAAESEMAKRGLEAVKDAKGNPLKVGNRMIVELKGDVQFAETKAQADRATETINATRDPQKSSPDSTAKAKAPKKKSKK